METDAERSPKGDALSITAVFTSFAILFTLAGWLFPHDIHRLGYRMALFYISLAFISAVFTALRRPKTK
ncbi:hypothetical protein NFI95_00525 [Acetobacteraceae bacterium KSS8]|uniref:Uncharacterized protein n=1 Tax=Endosaccharibacter trunci TaxID=2812733 RepID=A0ABT1W238_9PROT|nr:hypothetical protein [Acetobacteraceae bacterium KSS8]